MCSVVRRRGYGEGTTSNAFPRLGFRWLANFF